MEIFAECKDERDGRNGDGSRLRRKGDGPIFSVFPVGLPDQNVMKK
jgi:hypothetical protein